jgi:ABC-type sugar transport system ATPase subunit
MTTPRLAIHDLTKDFGSTTVLHGVSLDVARGEVHGLIGQNGAGKSTLVKTLAGLYPDHGGTIEIDGVPVILRTPRQARTEGVAVIYQEFSLVPAMTVAENLLLGREPRGWGYSGAVIRRRAAALVAEVGIDIGAELDTPVSGLSPAVRQRIEIVKALADDVKLLIMDEPTARLSEAERGELFEVIRQLSSREVAVVFISHYLDEVRAVTDRITVMRNGRIVATLDSAQATVDRMAALMLGDEFLRTIETESRLDHADDANPVIYEAEDISVGTRLRNVSLALRTGEIHGVAGLVGSGRTRLCRVLAGADRPTSGRLLLHGEPVSFADPRAALAEGIALIPEDRKYQALSMESPIGDNLVLMALQRGLGTAGVVPRAAVRRLAERLIDELQIVPADMDRPVGALSGGNQQKVVLGKAFAAEPEVLLIDQPTAGVDVGTKSQIHRLLRQRADGGAAILVVSDDLDELYALSDRIDVLRAGELVWSGRSSEIEYPALVELISSGRLPAAS